MRTLYLECASGISGDMTVAALLDLGADQEVLKASLDSLGVEGYHCKLSRVTKSGIDACDFDVHLHDHDHHSHHGEGHGHDGHHHAHPHDHDHSHAHHHHGEKGHGHHHSHGEEPAHTHHHSEHRNLGDILGIIAASGISPRAKELSERIFTVIARAEAKVHGLTMEEVHFHEVGAVDSIVDIVAAAVCIDNLGVDQIICSPLSEGTGTVRCQHGVMPVPAPATLEIARSHKVPLVITENRGEMVTPTGIGIVAALADRFGPPPAGAVIEKVGYGAGKREFAFTANLLRACLLEGGSLEGKKNSDQVVELACNIDDMTGEALALACEKLFAAGALDVWCAPIYMKKNRPAQMLSLLVPSGDQAVLDRVLEVLFRHTTTAGVRKTAHQRYVMARRQITVETKYGPVKAKELSWDGFCKIQVEYEDAKKLAERNNVSVNEIMRSAYSEGKG